EVGGRRGQAELPSARVSNQTTLCAGDRERPRGGPVAGNAHAQRRAVPVPDYRHTLLARSVQGHLVDLPVRCVDGGLSGQAVQVVVRRSSGLKRAAVNPPRQRIAVPSASATGRRVPSSRTSPHSATCSQAWSSTIL